MTGPADRPERRPLPPGHADEHATTFIPRPLRSYYVTVTARAEDFDTVLDASCDWIETDTRRRHREASW